MAILANINWLAVGAAAVASMIIGALWYSPIMFGKRWMKELGVTEEDLKESNNAMLYIGSLILAVIIAVGINYVMLISEATGIIEGLKIGLITAICFAGTTMATNHIFERRSFTFTVILVSHWTVYFAVAGIIIGAWG